MGKRTWVWLALAGATLEAPIARRHDAHTIERIAINDNRRAAGTLRDRVLTLRLEVREGEWHPDGDASPGVVVRAFAEEGQPLQVPGPLVRVPRGTEIRAVIRNTLADSSLVVHGLAAPGTSDMPAGPDTIRVLPGAEREVRFVAGTAGTHHYWATTTNAPSVARPGVDSQLGGAFIVDDPAVPPSPSERVLVMGHWTAKGVPTGITTADELLRFTINGRVWPYTERLAYTVGDSVQFRIVNQTFVVHPMHLHGFYFNVDSRGDGRTDRRYDPKGPHHLVVTERMAPGTTVSLTWVPERAGNWLFHCHNNFHILRNHPLDGSPLPPEHKQHVENHAEEMMGGLVMGVAVKPRGPEPRVASSGVRRRLRLFVREDSGGTEAAPAYGYVLQDGARRTPAAGRLIPGPTIVLRRNEPVAISVINQLQEATAVHWHGIELDSYFDGVAGFSGSPGHISPVIAPRDSFVARFTPPRAGTFIYHPHADEVRQQDAGLSGAIVVLDSGVTFDRTHDVVLLISTPRVAAERASSVYLNGTNAPTPLEWRVGERYRLRVVNIHTFRPSMIAMLQRDSTMLAWRALAKDGMDLPPQASTVRPARVQLGNGETYDYEYIPDAPGAIRFRVIAGAGPTLVTLPINVR